MSPCQNCVMRKQKQISFTKSAREFKKSTQKLKPVGVEVELQNNSQSDVVADTRETPETVAQKLEIKQVGAEVELLKDSHSDVVADTQENSETLAEETVVKQVGVEGLVT